MNLSSPVSMEVARFCYFSARYGNIEVKSHLLSKLVNGKETKRGVEVRGDSLENVDPVGLARR